MYLITFQNQSMAEMSRGHSSKKTGIGFTICKLFEILIIESFKKSLWFDDF